MDSDASTQPAADRPSLHKLSVVIPVYNEVDLLREVLARVERVRLPEGLQREIVIVDDHSRDGTAEVLEKLAAERPDLRVVFHSVNRGKGAALRSGFERVGGDIVIVQDADLEYDPEDYPRLLGPILDNKAEVVFGSRFTGGQYHRVLRYWHSMGNRLLTHLSNTCTNLYLSDMETCYKVFRKDVLDRITIEEDRFGFEPEITAKVARLVRHAGVRVYEVGISYHGRGYAEGKKINWKDAVQTVWCVLKYNLLR